MDDDFDILSLLNEPNYPIEVICYTPLGNPLSVIAQNAEHAAWLIATNPKPTPEFN